MTDTPPDEERAHARRQQIDEVLSKFRDAQEGVTDRFVRPDVPLRLHHYTTVGGLMGITSSDSLWASDVRFMNDSSELSYATELIADVVEESIAYVTNDDLRAALSQRRGFANTFEYGERPFIACFCEKEDLLSQWRGYDAGENGFSLGMDLSLLARTDRLPPKTHLRRVVYDQREQEAAVTEVVGTWIETAEALLRSDDLTPDHLFPYPAIWALQEALVEHHLCFKHPTFAEEREWRLIKLVDVREELRLLEDRRQAEMLRATQERMKALGVDQPQFPTDWGQANAEGVEIKFRTAPIGLVPYVELPLKDFAGLFTDRLPLWQVVQGPTPNPDLSLESLRMYLESQGFGFHTEVKASRIPLRR